MSISDALVPLGAGLGTIMGIRIYHHIRRIEQVHTSQEVEALESLSFAMGGMIICGAAAKIFFSWMFNEPLK